MGTAPSVVAADGGTDRRTVDRVGGFGGGGATKGMGMRG
jgi:hypothetical protein